MYDGIVIIDGQGVIRLFNPAAERIFQYAAEEVVGRSLSLLLPEEHHRHHQAHVNRFEQESDTARKMEERGTVSGVRKDGKQFPLEISISKITVGGAREYCALIRDASEQERMIRELNRRAYTDPLTGLNNRHFLSERGAELFTLCSRYNHPISLMVIDADHFKAVNDTYGHDAGDEVLKNLAKTLTAVARSTDIVARFGGEEFIILLPETESAGAVQLAERVRSRIEKAGTSGADEIAITVSIGVASYNGGDDFDALFRRADKALYAAKESGRNRVVNDHQK